MLIISFALFLYTWLVHVYSATQYVTGLDNMMKKIYLETDVKLSLLNFHYMQKIKVWKILGTLKSERNDLDKTVRAEEIINIAKSQRANSLSYITATTFNFCPPVQDNIELSKLLYFYCDLLYPLRTIEQRGLSLPCYYEHNIEIIRSIIMYPYHLL